MKLIIGIAFIVGGTFLIWLGCRPRHRNEIKVEKFIPTNTPWCSTNFHPDDSDDKIDYGEALDFHQDCGDR